MDTIFLQFNTTPIWSTTTRFNNHNRKPTPFGQAFIETQPKFPQHPPENKPQPYVTRTQIKLSKQSKQDINLEFQPKENPIDSTENQMKPKQNQRQRGKRNLTEIRLENPFCFLLLKAGSLSPSAVHSRSLRRSLGLHLCVTNNKNVKDGRRRNRGRKMKGRGGKGRGKLLCACAGGEERRKEKEERKRKERGRREACIRGEKKGKMKEKEEKKGYGETRVWWRNKGSR
jgi:hypothetical protein